jgi:predicted ArsR family transcriptional regulator
MPLKIRRHPALKSQSVASPMVGADSFSVTSVRVRRATATQGLANPRTIDAIAKTLGVSPASIHPHLDAATGDVERTQPLWQREM